MNFNQIIVFDMETGSTNPETCEVLQIAATVIDPRTLEIKSQHEFNSLIKPNNWANVEAKALEVNKLKKEDLEAAPCLPVVWRKFVEYVEKFNHNKSFYTAPIAAGANIKNFDCPIVERLSKTFGNVDKEGKSSLFNKRDRIDLLDICFLWFENHKEPENYKMDTLRDYLGLSKEGAHNALQDVRDTAKIISRFMRFHRNISKPSKFKGAFA